MKIVKSPLVLKGFYALNTECVFIEPHKEVNAEAIFDKYQLDFDFDFVEQDKNTIMLFTKIKINSAKNYLPGYKIFVEAMTFLSFDNKEKLTDKDKMDLVFISGLSMAINNLRAFISNLTSYYPFEKYTIPAINVLELHKMKKIETEKQ